MTIAPTRAPLGRQLLVLACSLVLGAVAYAVWPTARVSDVPRTPSSAPVLDARPSPSPRPVHASPTADIAAAWPPSAQASPPVINPWGDVGRLLSDPAPAMREWAARRLRDDGGHDASARMLAA